MEDNKRRLRNLLILFIIFSNLLLVRCTLFRKKRTIIEPAHIAIIDESRVNNIKIRCIFEEFLLRGVIDKGKGNFIVSACDYLRDKNPQTGTVEYFVSFNVMNFGIHDIEHGIEKILVSTKIVRCESNVILASFIESAAGKNNEAICEEVANKLSGRIAKKLLSLCEYEYEAPDMLSPPEDSL